MKLPLSVAFLNLLMSSPHIYAHDIIEEFRVTATHIPDTTPMGRTPKVTITAAQVEALAPNSFADILRGVPGIDIIQQGGLGGLTFLSLRGGDPNFVVIMINGVKVNDPTNSRGGAFDLGTLDPAIIDKVEIFYGSYSAVYGSDALAGVISIQTKSVEDDRLGFASIKRGSNNTVGGTLHIALPIAKIAILSMSASYQNGDDSSFGNEFRRKELIASFESIDNETIGWNFGIFIADGRSASFPEDSGGNRLAGNRTPETREFTQTNTSGRLFWQATDDWRIDLATTWSRRSETISNPGIAPGVLFPVPPIDSDSEYERTDISLTNIIDVTEIATVALGSAYTIENGETDSIIDFGFPVPADYTLKRDTKSIFIEAGIDPVEGLHITTGLRLDKADQVEATTSRVIARYQVTGNSTLSAQFSEGFKLPSFFALGHPFVGNPDLRAERSKNYDLSFEANFFNGKLFAKASAYKNTFSDLVDFDPILFTTVNRSMVEASGIEVFVSAQVHEQISLSGSVTFNRINAFDPDTVLRRRPEWKGGLQVYYKPLDTLVLTGRVTFNDSYFDSSIPTGMVSMEGFSRVDMSAAWDLMENLTVRLTAINLLNNQFEEAIGFTNMGRSLTASLAKSF